LQNGNVTTAVTVVVYSVSSFKFLPLVFIGWY